MRRMRRARCVGASLGLLVAACSSATPTSTASPTPPHGGTLRAGIALAANSAPGGHAPPDARPLDFPAHPTNAPQAPQGPPCCLARTPFSHSPPPTLGG